MKPFDTLNEHELRALTADQVSTYIDLLCAEDGVPLLPFLPPKPTAEWPEPDATAFYIKLGYHDVGIQFPTSEDAAKILDALMKVEVVSLSYITTPSNKTSEAMSRERPRFEMTSKPVYSAALYDTTKTQMAEAKRDEDAYNLALAKYNKAVEARQRIVDWVNKTIEEAFVTQRERDDLTQQYERYLVLSEGNRKIAWNFLLKAESKAKQVLPTLAEEFDAF